MSYLHPGVYIEEIAGGARPIEAVGTSTTAFVGIAEKGPINNPKFITSFSEFQAIFGNYVADEDIGKSFLAYSVFHFFQNGGAACYVVRVEVDATFSELELLTAQGEETMKLKAASPGKWGDRLRVAIGPPTTAATGFNMYVFIDDELVELIEDLSMVDSDSSFVDRMSAGSSYIQTKAVSLPDNPTLIGKKVLPAGGIDLQTVKKIRFQIDDITPITIDCSATAVDKQHVKAEEIVAAINNAFADEIREPVAAVDEGRIRIKSTTTKVDSKIIFTEPGRGDATYEIFGLQESSWKVSSKTETAAQVFGMDNAAEIYNNVATGPSISIKLDDADFQEVTLAQGAGDTDAEKQMNTLFGVISVINSVFSDTLACTDGKHIVLYSDQDITISQSNAAVILGEDFFSYLHTTSGDKVVTIKGESAITASDGDMKLKVDEHPSFIITTNLEDTADSVADKINKAFNKTSKLNKKVATVEDNKLILTSVKKGSQAKIIIASHINNPVAGDIFGTAHQNNDNFYIPSEKQSITRLQGEKDFTGEDIGTELANKVLRLSAGAGPVQFTIGLGEESSLEELFFNIFSQQSDLNYKLLTQGTGVNLIASSTIEKPELRLSIPLSASGLHEPENTTTLTAYKALFGSIAPFDTDPDRKTPDYEYLFGLPDNNPAQTVPTDADEVISKYALSLKGGKQNRESENGIVNVTIGTDGKSGLRALDKLTDISLLVIPGWEKMGRLAAENFINNGTGYCDKIRPNAARPLRDLFFVTNTPADVLTPTDAKNFARNEISTISAGGYTSLYYPWITVLDPSGTKTPTISIPPAGAIAGLYANIDKTRGVWKAPAGTEAGVAGVVKLADQVSDVEQDLLNPFSVNAVRRIPGAGVVSWGARTLYTNPEWKYVPVRRTAIMLEVSIYEAIQWAVFEPNDHRLWSALRLNIDSFMNGLFRSGAFQGEKSSDAYFVRCGLNDTMTQGDIDRGQVIVLVGFAPLKPAEFVIIRIQQKAGKEQ